MPGRESDRILLVSGEVASVQAVEEAFSPTRDVLTVTARETVLARLSGGRVAAVLVDDQGPMGSGLELLRQAVELQPDTLRVLLCHEPTLPMTLAAINEAQVSAIISHPVSACGLTPLFTALQRETRRGSSLRAEISRLEEINRDLDEQTHGLSRSLKDKDAALARLTQQLEAVSIHDRITGLYSTKYLHVRAEEEVRRARRRRAPVSLVLCDVDEDAPSPAREPAEGADELLGMVARLFTGDGATRPVIPIRDSDLLARYGRRSVGLLLPDTGKDGAGVVAERLRASLTRRRVRSDAREAALRACIGVASYPDDANDRTELVACADRALDEARHDDGRVVPFHRN